MHQEPGTHSYPPPLRYMNMPVGFLHGTEHVVCLSEAINRSVSLFDSFEELNLEKQRKLVMAVLRGCDDYLVYAMGGDGDTAIDRARALMEVEQGTEIGQQIVENEGLLIMTLLHRFAPAEAV